MCEFVVKIKWLIVISFGVFFFPKSLHAQTHPIFQINDEVSNNNAWLMSENGDTLFNDSAEVYFYSDSILISRRAGYYRFWNWNFDQLLADSIEDIKYNIEGNLDILIAKRKGKWGYFNSNNGKLMVHYQFESTSEFYEGIALVQKGTRYHYINTNGIITKNVTQNVRDYYNEWGTHGRPEPISMKIPHFNLPEFRLVLKDNNYGIRENATSNWILPLEYREIIGNFGAFVIVVNHDLRYGIYNLEDRKFVTECTHHYISIVNR